MEQSREKVAPSRILKCSCYWKRELSGRPRLRSANLLIAYLINYTGTTTEDLECINAENIFYKEIAMRSLIDCTSVVKFLY